MTKVDDLHKLNDLLQQEIITREEFEAQKQKILRESKPPADAGTAPQPQVQQRPLMPPMPPTHMVSAVLVTLLCCLPFGIAAFVNAAQVSSAYAAGNYNLAVQNSDRASSWVNTSLIVGIIGGVLLGGIYVASIAISTALIPRPHF